MPATPRNRSFVVKDAGLIRTVTPQRGKRYEHPCPLDTYRELVWAAIDLATDGFTVETLVEHVRNRPHDEHDDRDPWMWYTNAAAAIEFW